MKRSMIYTMLFAIALLSLQTLQAQMPRLQDKVIYWQQTEDFWEYQKIPRIDYGTGKGLYAITSGHENIQQIRLTITQPDFNMVNASLTTNINDQGTIAANKISFVIAFKCKISLKKSVKVDKRITTKKVLNR